MAAYASTATFTQLYADKFGGVNGLAVLTGKLNVTNYNSTTKPEITAITGKFKTVFSVLFGVSDNGHIFEFDPATGAVKVWHGDYTNASDGPLVEAVTDTDVGEAQFVAIGLA